MHFSGPLRWGAALPLIFLTLPAFICPNKAVLLPFEKDGKWGFIKPDQTIAIAAQYKDVQPFSEDMAAFKVDGHKWGFVGADGWVKIEPIFWLVGDFHNSRAWTLTVEEKWRYIDPKGKFINHPELQYASDFSEKRANVMRNGRYGYIDDSGSVVVPFEFDMAYPYSEGQGLVLKGSQWSALDLTGKKLYSIKCDEVFPLSEGLARCRIGNLWGYLDTAGGWQIQPSFERALDFKTGMAPAAKKNGPWMMIDPSGREVFRFPESVRWVYPFTCPEATAFQTDTGFGIIDNQGKILKEPKWEFARCLGGGVFHVRYQKRWSYYHIESGYLWRGSPTDR